MQTVCEVVSIIVHPFLSFFRQHVSLASTLGLAEDFQKYQQSIKNHDTFKMHQYHDTFW